MRYTFRDRVFGKFDLIVSDAGVGGMCVRSQKKVIDRCRLTGDGTYDKTNAEDREAMKKIMMGMCTANTRVRARRVLQEAARRFGVRTQEVTDERR